MIAHNADYFTPYFTISLKSTTSTRASGVTRIALRSRSLSSCWYTASRDCGLLQKAASLIADFDLKVLVEGPHHGGADAPDVVRILGVLTCVS